MRWRVGRNRPSVSLLPSGIERDLGLSIKEGRHPVLDQTLIEEKFVPNDTLLDEEKRLVIITGPNMAG